MNLVIDVKLLPQELFRIFEPIARESISIQEGLAVKGHDIPHPGVTKIPHPISQD
jgi:hypothetical protein